MAPLSTLSDRAEICARLAARAGCTAATVEALVSRSCPVQPSVAARVVEAANELDIALFRSRRHR